MGELVDDNHIDEILGGFGKDEFTTSEFVKIFKTKCSDDWKRLVKKYGGPGGRGHGAHYSPHSYLAQQLLKRQRRGELLRRKSLPPRSTDDWRHNGFKEAPEEWGSRAVALWRRAN